MTLTLQADETTAGGFSEAWESSTVTRNFIVRYVSDDGTDSLTGLIELHDARGLSNIPSLGDEHPVLGWGCVSVVADYVDASHHVVSVAATYRQTLATLGAVEFTEVQLQPQLEFIDIYRDGVSIPASGDVTSTNEDVGGGTCVGVGGYAVSKAIVTGTLTITHDQSGLPYWAWLVGMAGCRNSVGFIGFNAGSLVYLGPSLRRTGSVVSTFEGEGYGTYEVTHTFQFDQWLHCRQYAAPSSFTGLPLVDSDGCVENLKWIQPFSCTTNFWAFGIPGLEDL